MIKKPPKRIWYGISKNEMRENTHDAHAYEVTWCGDQINDTDIEYVLKESPMKPISKMTPAELNEAMAVEVMKWTSGKQPSRFYIDDLGNDVWIDKCGLITASREDVVDYYYCPADNDKGHSDCYRAEEKIIEFGLTEEYIDNLLEIVHGDGWPEDYIFDLIHATPEQRCRAMLRTVRNE